MPTINEQIADAHNEALSTDPEEEHERAMEKIDIKFQQADDECSERGVE